MADENDCDRTASVNGKNDASGAPCDDTQWVSVLQPDLLELDKHTLSTLQSLPAGTILLEPSKGGVPSGADISGDTDSRALHGVYLRPIMLNDYQEIPTVLTRSQERGLNNDECSSANPELSIMSFKDGNAEICDSDNKNTNHVSINSRSDLEGALRLDGSLFIKDDNLNDPHSMEASWGHEPNQFILTAHRELVPKTEGDIMVDVGVRVQNDPWLATFEDTALQKSPSGRALEAVPEELSPLVDGAGEKIGDYLEAEDQEGGNNSPPQITVSTEEFKVKTETVQLEPSKDHNVVPQPAKITVTSESLGSNLSQPKGTYLSHLPVKKRKMDNSFTVSNSGNQLVAESVPQVSMVAMTSMASPLVLPASSMTASSLLLSALTAVPKSSKATGASLTTGLCVNSTTGLLEPVTSSSSANILNLVSGTAEGHELGSAVAVVVTPLAAENVMASTSIAEEEAPSALPCADNPNFVATFCCTYCQAELETWEKAQTHRFTHQLDSTNGTFYVRYLCTPCGGSFDTWEEAQEHSADTTSMPLVTCNVCSSLIPANNMYDHITRHTKQTPEKLSTKLAVQVLKLQKDEANLNLTLPSKNSNSESHSSALEHLPLSKKLELQTALLQADIKRFRVLRKTIKKVQRQSSSSTSSGASASTSTSASASLSSLSSSSSSVSKPPGGP